MRWKIVLVCESCLKKMESEEIVGEHEFATMDTEELIALHRKLEGRDDAAGGAVDTILVDIESVLLRRGEIDRLVRGY